MSKDYLDPNDLYEIVLELETTRITVQILRELQEEGKIKLSGDKIIWLNKMI